MDKVCGKCKVCLPLSDFHRASREKSGYQQWCKACRKGHDVEGRKKYHRERYHNGKEQYLDWTYRRHYGIGLVEYTQMLEVQGGVCAICGCPCATGRRLAVDHCHTTGKVRGLLCGNCNKGLGSFKDDPRLIRKAIDYLEKAK